jgi:hypothetical protein
MSQLKDFTSNHSTTSGAYISDDYWNFKKLFLLKITTKYISFYLQLSVGIYLFYMPNN